MAGFLIGGAGVGEVDLPSRHLCGVLGLFVLKALHGGGVAGRSCFGEIRAKAATGVPRVDVLLLRRLVVLCEASGVEFLQGLVDGLAPYAIAGSGAGALGSLERERGGASDGAPDESGGALLDPASGFVRSDEAAGDRVGVHHPGGADLAENLASDAFALGYGVPAAEAGREHVHDGGAVGDADAGDDHDHDDLHEPRQAAGAQHGTVECDGSAQSHADADLLRGASDVQLEVSQPDLFASAGYAPDEEEGGRHHREQQQADGEHQVADCAEGEKGSHADCGHDGGHADQQASSAAVAGVRLVEVGSLRDLRIVLVIVVDSPVGTQHLVAIGVLPHAGGAVGRCFLALRLLLLSLEFLQGLIGHQVPGQSVSTGYLQHQRVEPSGIAASAVRIRGQPDLVLVGVRLLVGHTGAECLYVRIGEVGTSQSTGHPGLIDEDLVEGLRNAVGGIALVLAVASGQGHQGCLGDRVGGGIQLADRPGGVGDEPHAERGRADDPDDASQGVGTAAALNDDACPDDERSDHDGRQQELVEDSYPEGRHDAIDRRGVYDTAAVGTGFGKVADELVGECPLEQADRDAIQSLGGGENGVGQGVEEQPIGVQASDVVDVPGRSGHAELGVPRHGHLL
ncbi:hypothetical protein [Embleya scabrispora]|uniref:hypothetical protein n=1 Tax=Embleya scabrispora TaxID=159449 RepID=UPI00117D5C9E|nr:hypothetical protein [Embleya scabrispora]